MSSQVTHAREQELLPEARFLALLGALASGPAPAEAHARGRETLDLLRASYAEPSRAYHDARHIAACLALFDDAEVHALAEHPAEVEAALWFHDAVYDTHARDNEAKSAALAERCLRAVGVPAEAVLRIASHVCATKDHIATSADAALVIDIDLSILGAPAGMFAAFEREIRTEYAWVEPAAYVAGRGAVLRRFLARPQIFGTPLFVARYESRARENLASAIAALETRA